MMNNPNINVYVILLLIYKCFPKSVFQIQQLVSLWEERVIDQLPSENKNDELSKDFQGNPIWKSRIVAAISELLALEYIKKTYPYSMQHQRYCITEQGIQEISNITNDDRIRLSGRELLLSDEIDKVVPNIPLET